MIKLSILNILLELKKHGASLKFSVKGKKPVSVVAKITDKKKRLCRVEEEFHDVGTFLSAANKCYYAYVALKDLRQ